MIPEPDLQLFIMDSAVIRHGFCSYSSWI